MALVAEGADLVDVGGESTRPGAERVPADEELRRVVPVVRALAGAGALVSVDTTRAEVAAAALDAGAVLVNDVSGGLADGAMGLLVASTGVGYICMHSRGPSATMQQRAVYDDVVRDVIRELDQRLGGLAVAGVRKEQVAIDPGLGFAKKALHNWTLLARLAELHELQRPILVGASRKGFLGSVLADSDGSPRPVDDREDATVACTVLAAVAGAWCIRVHEARRNVDAVRVVAAAAEAARSKGSA
jgi:dihydropteroate synthase